MNLLLRCIAESVAEKGLKALAELVPGGGVAFDIADGAWKKWRDKCKDEKQREEIKQLAESSFEEAKAAAVEAAKAAAADQPQLLPLLEGYLTQIPASIRQSLKRSDDPTGKTVPPNFAIRSASDMARLLPSGPRFKPGDPLPGRLGWSLERQLGIGGFGEVWLARQAGFESQVGAVKFFRSSDKRDLLHESKVIDYLLKHGSHANLVALKGAHLDGDTPWLMYEYVKGGDLAGLVRRWAKWAIEDRQKQVVNSLRQLAKGVGFFHRLNPPIVHRDLKPANILYDYKTKLLRITDFGIGGVTARQMVENETRENTTKAGRLPSDLYGSHTPLYASPQQREGQSPDPRDDVYALGVIGYQMLTCELNQGVGPDFAEDLKELKIHDELIQLLQSCTAHKAERRPKDATFLAETLKTLTPAKSAAMPPMATLAEPQAEVDLFADMRLDIRDYSQAFRSGNGEQFIRKRAPERIGRWKEAAQLGFAPAQHLYALSLTFGAGTQQNHIEAVRWFREAAEKGFLPAANILGYMYLEGRGVPKDDAQALVWYRKAAEQGFAAAYVGLGAMYSEGRGVAKDDVHALHFFRKAAEQGFAPGQHGVGVMYSQGRGVPKDDAQALVWYRKAAEQGFALAQLMLGILHFEGRVVAKNDVHALHLFRKAAEQGIAAAQGLLGTMYFEGRGVSKDNVQALVWYHRAAEQGILAAQGALGRMYAEGNGVTKDEEQAAAWYRKAAEQGDMASQYSLGCMYLNGQGLPKDEEKAAAWYRKAAEQGHVDAQNLLGVLYLHGQGVPSDDSKAVHWFRKAAEQGNANSQDGLGYMYLEGRGVPKDDAQAMTLFRKAAEQGHADAQYQIGFIYENGRGVRKNEGWALTYYLKAADQGHENAKKAARRLGS